MLPRCASQLGHLGKHSSLGNGHSSEVHCPLGRWLAGWVLWGGDACQNQKQKLPWLGGNQIPAASPHPWPIAELSLAPSLGAPGGGSRPAQPADRPATRPGALAAPGQLIGLEGSTQGAGSESAF